MGASASTSTHNHIDKNPDFLRIKLKNNVNNDKDLVYLDVKNKKIIPQLKPLQGNLLYIKRKL